MIIINYINVILIFIYKISENIIYYYYVTNRFILNLTISVNFCLFYMVLFNCMLKNYPN